MNDSEKSTVKKMIFIYCRNKHSATDTLCDECQILYDYAFDRLSRCKYGEEKPTCETCSIHCYKPKMKEQVQRVMRYAGPRMIIYHPLLALRHLLKKIIR